MTRPISAGDLCEVLGGLGRHKSPNIGLQVTVGHRIMGDHGMDHTQFGRVHRCEGPGVKQISDSGDYIDTGWADFPVAWLRRIEPPPVTPISDTVDNGLTA